MKRTNANDPDFIALVQKLDAELAERDGADHSFYAQFNKINMINYAVVAYENGVPAGCGAIKEFAPRTMEVKRMYTVPGYRGKGIAKKVLAELEAWASDLGFGKSVLETGKKQPEAIELYSNSGYSVIPNYGQYAGVENSVCFEKILPLSNKQVVRSYIELVLNTGNLDRLTEFVSPDYTEVYQNVRFLIGIEGARQHILGVRQTYPDLALTIDMQIAEGEWVATSYTMQGTHLGRWMDIAPTGKKIEITGVNLDRVIEGKIVEHGGAANLFTTLLEIGAIQVVK